jgi:putative addiction module component (TIGR02574 family)
VTAAHAQDVSHSKEMVWLGLDEERLQLIGDLWDSLRTQPDSVRLTRAQRDELDRRLDDLDRGGAGVVSWDEAKRRLRSKSA